MSNTTLPGASHSGAKSGAARTAIIRDQVQYNQDGACLTAPRGTYRLEPRGNCIGLCHCESDCDFTLTFDSFQQYVCEGRLRMID